MAIAIGHAVRVAVVRLEGREPLLVNAEVPVLRAPAVVDLSALADIGPFDCAVLGILVRKAADRGDVKIVPPTSTQAVVKLSQFGVADHLGLAAAHGPPAAQQVIVPLTHLEKPHDWDEILQDLWPGVASGLGAPRVARRIFEVLGELVDNATTHGDSKAGTLVCAVAERSDRGLQCIKLAVADGGIGIPRHLRRRDEYAVEKSDEKLIQLARRPWVTGTRDKRGWGLVEVFQEAAATGSARILIRSGGGQGRFSLRSGRSPRATYSGLPRPAQGTWINLEVRPGDD